MGKLSAGDEIQFRNNRTPRGSNNEPILGVITNPALRSNNEPPQGAGANHAPTPCYARQCFDYRFVTVLLPEFVTQTLDPDTAIPIGLRPTEIDPRFVPSMALSFVTLSPPLFTT